MRIRIVTSFSLLLFVAAVLAHPAQAQTCPAAPADPIPRDAVRLEWQPTTTWQVPPGGNIPTPTQIVYSVYKISGQTATLVCTTALTTVGQLGLPVGESCYAVTAKTPLSVPPNAETARTNTACKTIPPQTTIPSVPTGFTITGTGTLQLNLTVTPNP